MHEYLFPRHISVCLFLEKGGGLLGLERLGLSRYDEAQGLDASAGELVSTGNLMFLRVESSARKKSHTTFYSEPYQVYVHCNMLVMILREVI